MQYFQAIFQIAQFELGVPKGVGLDPRASWLLGVILAGLFLAGLLADLAIFRRWKSWKRHFGTWTEQLCAKAYSWDKVILLVIFLISCHLIAFSVYKILTSIGMAFSDEGMATMQSFSFHWAGLAFIFGYLHWKDSPAPSDSGSKPRRFSRVCVSGAFAFLASLPLFYLSALLYQLLLNGIGIKPELQTVVTSLLDTNSAAMRAYLVFLAIFIAPLFEELLFRGILLPTVSKKIGFIPALLLVSTGFAVLHFHLPTLLPLIVFSSALCLAYWRYGSIWVPVCMHALFNGINLTLLFLTVQP